MSIRKNFKIVDTDIRAILLSDGTIKVCLYDLCRAMKRPSMLKEKQAAVYCTSAEKIQFKGGGWAPVWGVSIKDAIKYIAFSKNESIQTKRSFKIIEEWLLSLSTKDFNSENNNTAEYKTQVVQSVGVEADIKTFLYNGTPVSFLSGKNKMINATQMGKGFDKSPSHWLRNSSTKAFISELAELRNCNSLELVQVTHGDEGNTWMHEDVALEFARWLSPSFAVWCNDRIKELMNYGVTATPMTLEQIISDPSFAIKTLTALQQERTEKENVFRKLEVAKAVIAQQEPKANYYNVVVEERELYTTQQIATELGMCYSTLRKKLFANGIVTSGRGSLLLAEGYENCGEMVHPVGKKNYQALKWNKLGRQKILNTLDPLFPV